MSLPTQQTDRRKPIGVDIDNVLAATDPLIRQLIQQFYGISAPQSAITTWRYSASLPITPENEDFIFTWFHAQAYPRLRLLKGARQSLAVLSLSYKIYLITSRPQTLEAGTIQWLRRKRIPYDQLFFLPDKTILAPRLAFVLEDNLDTSLAIAALGVPVYLFDYPWNRHPPTANIFRVTSWRDFMQKLSK